MQLTPSDALVAIKEHPGTTREQLISITGTSKSQVRNAVAALEDRIISVNGLRGSKLLYEKEYAEQHGIEPAPEPEPAPMDEAVRLMREFDKRMPARMTME